MELAPGTVVAGTLELRRRAGQGGMAQVWEAHDLQIDRRVALKLCLDASGSDALRAEAHALARIAHPCVPAVYALGTHEGRAFMAREWVHGATLEQHIDRQRESGQVFALAEALDVLVGLTEGLLAVHRTGMAHCDVKPGNVLLAPGRRVVLMDFGLARYEPAPDQDGETIRGSPFYIAPETLQQQVAPGHAHLVDVYALGAIIHEALTGLPPFQHEDLRTLLAMHLYSAPPDVRRLRPEVPAALAELALRMLAKQPGDRPRGLDAVLGPLRALRGQLQLASGPPSVLIVDDDDDFAQLAEASLRRELPGTSVERVASADEALRFVRAAPPRVLLLDHDMPGMSGLELCTYLRGTQLADDCTVVSISARAQEENLRAFNHLGVTWFVPKGADFLPRVTALLRDLGLA
jgi:serine/threonine protein kinase